MGDRNEVLAFFPTPYGIMAACPARTKAANGLKTGRTVRVKHREGKRRLLELFGGVAYCHVL